jgi:hypothetical protein
MKQQEVFKKIGGIIKELNDQFEYLKTIDGPLNELELELFLANSHFLGDHVQILSKLNSQNSEVKKKVQKAEAPHEQNFFVPLVHTPPPSVKAHDKPFELAKDDLPTPHIDLEAGSEDSYSFMHEDEPEIIRHELILDEADWVDEDEPYEPNTVHDALKQENDEEPAIVERKPVIQPVAEEPATIVREPVIAAIEQEPVIYKGPEPVKKADVLTINERMSAKLAEMAGVTSYGQSPAISDLKQGITLNDKLLFIKELFNGYSLAYSEAIEILNRFTSFNEAELFLKKNYVVKNTWEKKPETVEKFYELLKRRYV